MLLLDCDLFDEEAYHESGETARACYDQELAALSKWITDPAWDTKPRLPLAPGLREDIRKYLDSAPGADFKIETDIRNAFDAADAAAEEGWWEKDNFKKRLTEEFEPLLNSRIS